MISHNKEYQFLNENLRLILNQCNLLYTIENRDNYEILIECENLAYLNEVTKFIDDFLSASPSKSKIIKYAKLSTHQLVFIITKELTDFLSKFYSHFNINCERKEKLS